MRAACGRRDGVAIPAIAAVRIERPANRPFNAALPNPIGCAGKILRASEEIRWWRRRANLAVPSNDRKARRGIGTPLLAEHPHPIVLHRSASVSLRLRTNRLLDRASLKSRAGLNFIFSPKIFGVGCEGDTCAAPVWRCPQIFDWRERIAFC